MFKKVKALVKCLHQEKGQALVAVLIFLLIGSLTLPPALAHISTALKTGQVYDNKAYEMYAADSGIEDAMWQVKYDMLGYTLHDPDYDTYDYSTDWSYEIEPLNGVTASVGINNVWIPSNESPPDAVTARDMIERVISEYAETNENNKIIIYGTATDEDECRIKMDFYPAVGDEESLAIASVGIWLPLGFHYDGSCNLEEEPYNFDPPTVSAHNGGESVVWEFSEEPFTNFPEDIDSADYPQSADITFSYTADEAEARPTTVSWVTTSGSLQSDIPVAWDVDTKIFQITSTAGDTEIEAYASRCELRQMDAAIAGDYEAFGNSLMQDNYSPWGKRDTLLASSYTTIDTIPNGDDPENDYDIGDVVAAYLYWSGSYKATPFATPLASWPDDCSDFDNWYNTNPNTTWQVYSGRFRGHYTGSNPQSRYLEMASSYDLDGYSEGEVVVEWDQDEDYTLYETDGLTFELSGDGGSNWSDPITAFYDDIQMGDYSEAYFYYIVPQDYLTPNFKLRFHLEGFAVDDYCYIDDFAIAEITATADTTAKFWIDDTQVYLDGGVPQQGAQDIVASRSDVSGFEKRNEYAYVSFLDVTKLVKAYAEIVEDEYEDEHPTGNAKYTVGDVDADRYEYRSYAGWSMIIVYASQETAGHQLYLYEELALNSGYTNLDFDHDGTGGGDITGFVVPEPIEDEEIAATLTCFVGEGDSYTGDYLKFTGESETWAYLENDVSPQNNVWNSQSPGMSEPGVDIDTFYITWESGLIHADDTFAHIDLPSGQDNWMLIYMILSVRSETITGSTEHYVIRH
jgi:hypothetical protein